VQETPDITNVNVVQEKDESDGKFDTYLQFEGDNLQAIWMLSHECVDFSRLRTNDIHLMLQHYGVEAARWSIVNSIRDVFGHYGIGVDFRHLYLIADYMTKDGGFRPFNRAGLSYQASPWLQMTFETSMGFITQAATQLLRDELKSPAASIIVGNLPTVGTGAFDIVQDLEFQFDQTSQVQQRQFSMPKHGDTWEDADPPSSERRKRAKTAENGQ
jgi:DNA-directed RNA polymerase I subunit RPA1